MLNKINILIKILISITLFVYIYLFDYDYKVPLMSLIVAYLIGSIILNPLLQNNLWKFLVYILDIIMLTYFSYTTGNIYFSIFYYLLLIPERNLKQTTILILLSLPMVIYNFYQTNFYDFVYISLIVGINLFLIKNIYFSKKIEDEILKNVSITQECLTNYLKCKSKSQLYRKFYEVSIILNLFKRNKISAETFGKLLYENLNADAIVVYNNDESECYKFGCDLDCDKFFSLIKEEKLYVNEHPNIELGYRYIISKKINNNHLVLLYKNYILDEEDIVNLIKQ
ncbi:hypothetical protein [Sulfurihydrogenibium sp.]|uniref:hypothetical protein n=1 Tax=Sulfurihydrogenibium sp. TaxID=2053621 RepID=UPI002603B1CA|nr:hypothetical protein [Sulfurihydrogenibium sp.]